MKKKKKLTLNKEVLYNLDKIDVSTYKGGGASGWDWPCTNDNSYSCVDCSSINTRFTQIAYCC